MVQRTALVILPPVRLDMAVRVAQVRELNPLFPAKDHPIDQIRITPVIRRALLFCQFPFHKNLLLGRLKTSRFSNKRGIKA